ncbi:MXAN_6640 family putative metalloprotease [Nocardioides taihuensis]|uniref:MXAN_6640 family putative metalloprotease n=1 Tax=Nocardioides taihuensis TaxID=1835606 RepID=A0ABW0BKL3_9ACTN
MPSPRQHRATRLTAALSAVALGLGLALVAGAGPAAQAADRPDVPTPAQQALARAQALFDGTPATDRSGGAASGPADATLALRDLWALRGQLTGADRAAADALLARPAAKRKACTPRICVHWTPSEVSKKDGDKNGRPDYVDKVIGNVDGVHRHYVKAGYRAPKSDHGRGGNNKTDIYLRDVGQFGLYGYCDSDAKYFPSPSNHSVWAFCVLDNDYKSSQFPQNTPLENLQVTAAHEYYHAVQFAYDFLEDDWFMEASAAWAEDEVYDAVNDNKQYLASSPLTQPDIPLDSAADIEVYGGWIWFRYLTEKNPSLKGGMPVLLLRIWQAADSVGSGTDRYGVQAIQKVLNGKGSSLRDEFARFSAANLFAQTAYDEGTAQAYPEVTPDFNAGLSDGQASSPSGTLDHLTAATLRFRTQGTTSGATLAVSINLPDTTRGSAAVVTVNGNDGSHTPELVALDANGNADTEVAFGDDVVTSVDVTLVNASTRFRCNQGTNFSCNGTPQDDGLTSSASVEVLVP